MEKGVKQIIEKGKYIATTNKEKDAKGIGEKLKDRVSGDQAYFEFFCPSCKKAHVTKNKYKVEANYAVDMAGVKAESAIMRFIRKIIGVDLLKQIPIIGTTLDDHYETKYDAKEQKVYDAMDAKRNFRFKKEAFNEFSNTFRQSANGKYTCQSCDPFEVQKK